MISMAPGTDEYGGVASPGPSAPAMGAGSWLAVAAVSAAAGVGVIGALSRGPLTTAGYFVALVVGAGLTVGLRRGLLAIAVASLPFQMGISLAHDSAASEIGALGGMDVSVTTLAVVGLWTLWLIDRSVTADGPSIELRALAPFGVFVLVVALAALWARDVGLATNELFLLVESFLLGVYVAVWSRADSERSFVFGCLIASGALQAAAVVLARVTGAVPGVRVDVTLGSGAPRYGGTIGSPNAAGSFFAVILVLCLAVALTADRGWTKRIGIAAGPVVLVALVLTKSRGGWTGAAVGCALVLAVTVARGRVDIGRVVLGALAALFLVPLVAPSIVSRLTQEDAGAYAGRGPLIEMTADVIASEPLIGVGPNNLGPVLSEHEFVRTDRTWVYVVHNKYLLVWSEAGIVALAVFVWFLLASLHRARIASRSEQGQRQEVALGCGAAIVALAVHMNVEPFNTRPQLQTLVLLAALVAGAAHGVSQRRKDASSRV